MLVDASGDPTAIGAVAAIMTAMGGLFLLVSLLRGIYRNCVDLFGLHSPLQAMLHKNRPYSRDEHTLSLIIADMVTNPDGWAIVKSGEWRGTYDAVKGVVKIEHCDCFNWDVDAWYGYTGPKIIIAGLHSYTMQKVRPQLIRELWETVNNLRGERARNALLGCIEPQTQEQRALLKDHRWKHDGRY